MGLSSLCYHHQLVSWRLSHGPGRWSGLAVRKPRRSRAAVTVLLWSHCTLGRMQVVDQATVTQTDRWWHVTEGYRWSQGRPWRSSPPGHPSAWSSWCVAAREEPTNHKQMSHDDRRSPTTTTAAPPPLLSRLLLPCRVSVCCHRSFVTASCDVMFTSCSPLRHSTLARLAAAAAICAFPLC